MYGPAVRRKRFSSSCRFSVSHQCIRPLIRACAPGHHGYQRACVLITGQASSRPFGSPVFANVEKTVPPSLLILSRTSAGNRMWCYVIACSLSVRATPRQRRQSKQVPPWRPRSSVAASDRNRFPSLHANFQKSGLSAVGTAASFSVPYLCGFSAQTYSGHSPRGRP
jgi:hypothetical protein